MNYFKYVSLFVFMLCGISCFGMEQKSELQKTYSFNHPVLGSFLVETAEVMCDEITNKITCTVYTLQQPNSEKIKMGCAYVFIQSVENRSLEKVFWDIILRGYDINCDREVFSEFIKTLPHKNSTKNIRTIIEWNKIEFSDAFKGHRLGKYMFLMGLIEVVRMYPDSIGFGVAIPNDDRSKESLYQFYKSLGAQQIGDTDKFYIDFRSFDLGIFAPKSRL